MRQPIFQLQMSKPLKPSQTSTVKSEKNKYGEEDEQKAEKERDEAVKTNEWNI